MFDADDLENKAGILAGRVTPRRRARYAVCMATAAFLVENAMRFLGPLLGNPGAIHDLPWIMMLVPVRLLVFYLLAPDILRGGGATSTIPNESPSCANTIWDDVRYLLVLVGSCPIHS